MLCNSFFSTIQAVAVTCKGNPAIASANILTQAYTAVVCIAVRSFTVLPLVVLRTGRKMHCRFGFAVCHGTGTILGICQNFLRKSMKKDDTKSSLIPEALPN